MTPPDDAPPAIQDYDLLRPIGHGAYGDVWLARGLTGAYFAVKIVWRNRFDGPEPFEREFSGLRRFANLQVPNPSLLKVLHVGKNDAAGFFYYVMEVADDVETGRHLQPGRYVPLTLRELLARRGRVPAAEALRIAMELCESLCSLHSQDLVHRDIKPSNIVFVSGIPKLADIGLVTAVSGTSTQVGTEGFMPPEGPGKPSADVFAMGKILYSLATGLDGADFPRLPNNLAQFEDRALALELNRVAVGACDPDFARRPQNARVLLDALREIKEKAAPKRAVSLSWKKTAYLAAAALVAAAAFVWASRRTVHPAAAQGPSLPDNSVRSVAVLPFDNESGDKDSSAFFSDGVHEDIITNLGYAKDLHVMSRLSVLKYRGTKKTASEIGRELNVSYVLEGSVRRLENKVRVTGQLIDARNDQQVWAQTYDRELTDIFAIQADIARSVSAALKASLSSGGLGIIGKKTTENAGAYDLYLKARAKDLEDGDDPDIVSLLQSAVALDPNFAEAWARLAHAYAFHEFAGHTEMQGRAKQAIETAIRLAPESPEVVECTGDYFYYCFRDYARATEQYLKLLSLRPNDPEVYHSLSLIHRRQGRWKEAIAEEGKAHEIEPKSLKYLRILESDLVFTNHFKEAVDVERLCAPLRDSADESELQLAQIDFSATGSREKYMAIKARLLAAQNTRDLDEFAFDISPTVGDLGFFLDRAARMPPTDGSDMEWGYVLTHAVALYDTGKRGEALAKVRSYILRLRADAERFPERPGLTAWLGLSTALLGDKEEALRLMDKAAGTRPESSDAVEGTLVSLARASVWARVGKIDQALAEIARLSRVPGSFNVHVAHDGIISGISFLFLRGDPRFEHLIADPASNAPIESNGAEDAASP